MAKLIFLFFITIFFLLNTIYKAFAVAIYDENGKGENVQHIKITQNNYNGICYTKIAILEILIITQE